MALGARIIIIKCDQADMVLCGYFEADARLCRVIK